MWLAEKGICTKRHHMSSEILLSPLLPTPPAFSCVLDTLSPACPVLGRYICLEATESGWSRGQGTSEPRERISAASAPQHGWDPRVTTQQKATVRPLQSPGFLTRTQAVVRFRGTQGS